MNRKYRGVIWTKHALDRLAERKIKQGDAWATFNRPDTSRYTKSKDAFVYERSWNDTTIEIVAKKNDKGEWVILSVWSYSRLKIRNTSVQQTGFPPALLLRKLIRLLRK